jgi:hypothetical protein
MLIPINIRPKALKAPKVIVNKVKENTPNLVNRIKQQ